MSKKPIIGSRLMTVREVAAVLGVSYQSALRLVRAHLRWRQYVPNGCVYVESDSVREFLRDCGVLLSSEDGEK